MDANAGRGTSGRNRDRCSRGDGEAIAAMSYVLSSHTEQRPDGGAKRATGKCAAECDRFHRADSGQLRSQPSSHEDTDEHPGDDADGRTALGRGRGGSVGFRAVQVILQGNSIDGP